MTQPTSVDATFDTSLVDLKATSFSTTESDPSDFNPASLAHRIQSFQPPTLFVGQPQDMPNQQPQPSKHNNVSDETWAIEKDKARMEVQHIPTQDAYDQWASVYDSDGNMLQSIDDVEIPSFMEELFTNISDCVKEGPISLLDLGCGTGRNTAKVVSRLPESLRFNILGLDFSKGMLDIATEKLEPLISGQNGRVMLRLECCDCFPTVLDAAASPLPAVPNLAPVNAVISTLVLEHVPLTPYFATLSSLLLLDGLALITNMHADMGRVSQAGFVNAQGVKIRGHSFAHTVQDTIDEAKKAGFNVLRVRERQMEKEDIESGLVGERGLKWVDVNVWYGMLLKKNRVEAGM